MTSARLGRELLLEAVYMRTERRDPIGVEGVEEEAAFDLANIRRR